MTLFGEFRFPAAVAVFWCLAGFGFDSSAVSPRPPAPVQQSPRAKLEDKRPLPPVVPVHTHGSSR